MKLVHITQSGFKRLFRAIVSLIIFSSPLRFVSNVERPDRHKNLPKHKWLRKSHGDFSSYLGARPHALKVGIFRDVLLDIPGRSWIEDVWVRPKLDANFKQAKVTVKVETGGVDGGFDWILKDPSDNRIKSGDGRL